MLTARNAPQAAALSGVWLGAFLVGLSQNSGMSRNVSGGRMAAVLERHVIAK